MLPGLRWSEPTALEGRHGLFGLVVGVEFVLAGAGAAVFLLNGRGRWVAWWVAPVVALHFVSLAWVFDRPSLAWLGVVELVALAVGALLLRSATTTNGGLPTSTWVGPVMGLTILSYAILNGAVTLQRVVST